MPNMSLQPRPARRLWGQAGFPLAAVIVFVLTWAFFATGCGKKGPPVPPVDKREPVKQESLWRPPANACERILVLHSKLEYRSLKRSVDPS